MFTWFPETAAIISAVIGPVTYFSIKYLLRDVFSLNGDVVVVVTGASSGLGRACAQEFYRAGCQVVLCSRSVEKLRDVKNELLSMDDIVGAPEPVILKLDITRDESISEAVSVIEKKFPDGIHILVNNAGISYRGEVLSTSLDVDRLLMETNYIGQVALTKALLPSILKVKNPTGRTKAHILNVNSVQGKISIPNRSAYAASKFACEAFFDCLRSEVAHKGINVCSIYPGYIKTNLSLNAVTGDGSSYGKVDHNTNLGMDPRTVARRIVGAVRSCQKEVLVVTLKQRVAIWLRFLFPFVYFWIMKRRFIKESIAKN